MRLTGLPGMVAGHSRCTAQPPFQDRDLHGRQLALPYPSVRHFFKKLLTYPMIALAALIMFVEEWLWDRLTALMRWIARAPLVKALEKRLAELPPWGAVIAFLLPHLVTGPLNLFALWLTAHGKVITGATILIAVKILGTAILAWLFMVTRPTLLTVNWFRRVYEWLVRLKERLYASAPWVAAVRWKNRLKEWWRSQSFPLFRGRRLRLRRKAIRRWLQAKLQTRKAPGSHPPENAVSRKHDP